MHEILLTENNSEENSNADSNGLNTEDIDKKSILKQNSICNNATNKCVASSPIPDKYDEEKSSNNDRPKLIRHNLLSNKVSNMEYDSRPVLHRRCSLNQKTVESSKIISFEDKLKHNAEETLFSHNEPSELNTSREGISYIPENNALLNSPQKAIDTKINSLLDEGETCNEPEEIEDEQSFELVQNGTNEVIATDSQVTEIISKEPLSVSKDLGLSDIKEDPVWSSQSCSPMHCICSSNVNSEISIDKKKVERNITEIETSLGIGSKLATQVKCICSPSEDLVDNKNKLLHESTLDSSLDPRVQNFIVSEEINKKQSFKLPQIRVGLNENEVPTSDCQKSINASKDILSVLEESRDSISIASQLSLQSKYTSMEKPLNNSVIGINKKEAECDGETEINYGVDSKFESPVKVSTLDSSLGPKVENFITSEEINKEQPFKLPQISVGLNENQVLTSDCQKSINASKETLTFFDGLGLSDSRDANSIASQLSIPSKHASMEKPLDNSVIGLNKKEAECDGETELNYDVDSKLESPVKVSTLDSSLGPIIENVIVSEEINKDQPFKLPQISVGLNEIQVSTSDCQKNINASKETLTVFDGPGLSDSRDANSIASQLSIPSKHPSMEKDLDNSVIDVNKKEAECDIGEIELSYGIDSKLESPAKVSTLDSSLGPIIENVIVSDEINKEQPFKLPQISVGLNEIQVSTSDCQKSINSSKDILTVLERSRDAISIASQLSIPSKHALMEKDLDNSVIDVNKKEAECDIGEIELSYGIDSKLESPVKVSTLDSSLGPIIENVVVSEEINNEQPFKLPQISVGLNEIQVSTSDCQKSINSSKDILTVLEGSRDAISIASQLSIPSKHASIEKDLDKSVIDVNKKEADSDIGKIELSYGIDSKLESPVRVSTLDSSLGPKVENFIASEEINKKQLFKLPQISVSLNEIQLSTSDCQESKNASKDILTVLEGPRDAISIASQLSIPSKHTSMEKPCNNSVIDVNKKEAECDFREIKLSYAIDSKLESPVKVSTLDSSLGTKMENFTMPEEINKDQPFKLPQISVGLNENEVSTSDCQKSINTCEETILPVLERSELPYSKDAIKVADINCSVELPLIGINDNEKMIVECQESLVLNNALDLNLPVMDKAELTFSKELAKIELIVDKCARSNVLSKNGDSLGERSKEYPEKQSITAQLLPTHDKKTKESENVLVIKDVIKPLKFTNKNNVHANVGDEKSTLAVVNDLSSVVMITDFDVKKSVDMSQISITMPDSAQLLSPQKISIYEKAQKSSSPRVSNDTSSAEVMNTIENDVDSDEGSCLGNIKIVSVTSGISCSVSGDHDSSKVYHENSDDENISSAVSNIAESLYHNDDSNMVLKEDVEIIENPNDDTNCKAKVTNLQFSHAVNATKNLCEKIINLDEIDLVIDAGELSKCSSNCKRKFAEDEYEDGNSIKKSRTSLDPIKIKEEKFEGFPNLAFVASEEMDIAAVKQEIVEEQTDSELDLSFKARSKLLTSSFCAKNQKQKLKKLSPRKLPKSVFSKKKKRLLSSKNGRSLSNSEVCYLDIPGCLRKIADGSKPSLLVERERINVDAENEDDRKVLVTCLVFESTVLDWAFIDTLLSQKETTAVNIVQKTGGKSIFIFPPVDSPRDRYFCVDLGNHFPFVMPSQTSVDCLDDIVPLSYPLDQFATLCPSSTGVRAVSFNDKIIPMKAVQFAKEPLEFAFNNTLLSSVEDSPILSGTLDLPVDQTVWPDVPETFLLPNFNVDYTFPFTCPDKQRQYENVLFFPFETQIPLKLMESQLIQDIPDELQRELDTERSGLARLLGLASYYKYLSLKKLVRDNPQLSVTLSAMVSSFKPMIVSQANSYGMKIEEARLVALEGIYSKDKCILPGLIRGPVNGSKSNLFSQSGIHKLERSVCKNYFNVLKRKRQS